MSKVIFIEGVSGVGKSTMLQMLSKEFIQLGYQVKSYEEFDFSNPIDFYCTAYLSIEKYNMLCEKYPSSIQNIQNHTIDTGNVKLVRYYDKREPLFTEPLLSELAQYEFCYNPSHLVTLEQYTDVYIKVWQSFSRSINPSNQFILFDGSLLHHPINDMLRNYKITKVQAAAHVKELLKTLGSTQYQIIYLKTSDIRKQLTKAHANRGQNIPEYEEISYWMSRYQYDSYVLYNINENIDTYDIDNDGYDRIRKQILQKIINGVRHI